MKLLIKTIKDNWNYLLVWILVVLPWWLKSGYVFLVDFTWGPKMIPDIDSSWFIVQTLIKIDSLFVPVSVSGKAFLSLVILGVLVSGSRLAQRFTEDRFLVFIISLFALFNPFVYDLSLIHI